MAKQNNDNTWKIISGVAIGLLIIVLLFFSFGKQYISFLPHNSEQSTENPNIELVCSFSENPDSNNAPKDAIKCKFRNYGGEGEECFSVREYKVVDGKENFLDENNLCSGVLKREDYWSEYKYIYNSQSWEDYHLQDWTGWACGIGTEIDCLYENNIDRIGYIIKTSSN